MAIEHANSFVEKIFEDDEFLKCIVEKRNYNKNDDTNEEIENKKIMEIANSMGFRFDSDEFKEACKSYMSNIDGWEAAQKIFHVLKVVSNIYKQNM